MSSLDSNVDADLAALAAGLVGRPGESGAAPGLRIVAALAGHELRLAAGRGESLLLTFAIPVAVLAFSSAVDVVPLPRGRSVDALLPGAIALAVVASALVALSIGTAYERSYGVLKRLAGTPATPTQRIAARVAALLLIQALQVVVLVAVAAVVFGWRPGASANLPLLAATLALGSAVFAAIGTLVAGTLRAETTLAVSNALFLVALLLGDVVVPLDRLPDALAMVGRALPVAALVDLVRAALGIAPGDASRSGLILAAWGLVSATAAVRWTRWD